MSGIVACHASLIFDIYGATTITTPNTSWTLKSTCAGADHSRNMTLVMTLLLLEIGGQLPEKWNKKLKER
ncbi:hypothetical protein FRC11_003243, partial [Ceratobasidium sp. 423]